MLEQPRVFLDSNPISQPAGTTREMRNVLATKLKKAIFNENGFDRISLDFPVDGIITGGIKFPDESVVIFVARDGVNDEIGVIGPSEVYTKILGSTTLIYDVSKPIKGVGTYDAFGNRIVAWTNEVDIPRVLNIDSLPFAIDGNKDIINELELVLTSLFPESNAPIITATANVTGSLVTGVYFITAAYEDDENTRTEFHMPYGPIALNDESNAVSIDLYDGAVAGTPSGKGLSITLSNLDTRYSKLVVSIIAKIGGQYIVKNIVGIPISNTVVVQYTGSEANETSTLEEVIFKQPNYIKIRDLAVLSDRLYAANLEVDDEIDYQPQAMNIIVNYRTTLVSITRDIKSGNETTLMHEQVYALYIRWILTNGKVTRAFHIPGRKAIMSDYNTSTIAAAEGLVHPNGSPVLKFQIEDTSNINGQSYITSGNTQYVSDISKSNLGYWQNMNEVYPVGFPIEDPETQEAVRHHKMPTLDKCRTQHYSGNTNFGVNQLNRLSLDVSNVVLTTELAEKAVAYQILYAKIEPDNANVLAYDQLIYAHNISRQDNDLVWSLGMNARGKFKQAGTSSESNGDWRDMVIRKDFIRVHAVDLLKNKPSVNPTYIKSIYGMSRRNLSHPFADVGNQGGSLCVAGKDHGQVTAGIIDYTVPERTVISNTIPTQIKRVVSFKYLPSNVILEEGSRKLITNGCEETLSLELNNNVLGFTITVPQLFFGSPNETSNIFIDGPNNGEEQTYLITINQLKSNLYNNFYNQLLIPFSKGKLIDKGSTSVTDLMGDCFVCDTSYISGCPRINDNLNPLVNTAAINQDNGVFLIHRHLTIARNNINFRHIDGNIPGSKYYPKVGGLNWMVNPDVDGAQFILAPWDANVYEINDDYNSKNEFIQTSIFRPGLQNITNYPNRVIRSSKFNRLGTIGNSFRTFLDQEFYESNMNRGYINNLAVEGDVLLIHHRYGLFRTIGNEALKANATEIYLGTRDIFSIEPKEQVTEYLGNQQKFGTLTFKGGYVFTDASQGKVFLVPPTASAIEISNTGLRNWFISNLKGYTGDNPFNGEGIQIAFDEDNDRLLISKIAASNPFTRSYSFVNNGSMGLHDYLPNYMVSTRSKIFLQKGAGKIYKHNSLTKKCIFFEDTPFDSSITLVFNDNEAIDKTFFNLNWITHFITNLGEIDRNKTFTSIRVKTSYQDTGVITLTPYINLNNKGNVRKENNSWNFNKFRAVLPSPKNARFVDKYIEVTLTYNNAKNLDNSQNLLYLYNVDYKALMAER